MTDHQKTYLKKMKKRKLLCQSVGINIEKILLLIIVLSPLFVSSLSKVTTIGLVSLSCSFVLLLKVLRSYELS